MYAVVIWKIKNQKADTLAISSEFTGNLPLRERFTLISSTPLLKFDKTKIAIFNKNSVAIPFETEYDEINQKLYLNFKKEPLEKYKISLLPNALEDFYEHKSDSLKYTVTTKNASEYGNIKVLLENVKRFPVIVQLTDKDGKVKATEYTEKETSIDFEALEPAIYTLRIIYDDNKNKIWDTGSYLEKRQSEEVIYLPKEINLHANFDWEQSFDLRNSK